MSIENVSNTKSFGGWHKQYTHRSDVLGCDMRFAIFLPPQANAGNKVPVMYWLSGLTCTDENFMQKAGAQRVAAELGIAIIAPDTSPRGDHVPDDEEEAYDFGKGAGFYINATQEPWARNYRMYDYIVDELPALIGEHFPVDASRSVISGHSMGGHGALMIALRNPGRFKSVTAFSPICNPVNCPWGQKAFGNYLGGSPADWTQYDASELMAKAEIEDATPALVDQGDADGFLKEQLKPETLFAAAGKKGYPLNLRMQEGYDHSYYFIASFVEDHLRFHAKHLGLGT